MIREMHSKMADNKGGVSMALKSKLLEKIKAKQFDLEITNATTTNNLEPTSEPSCASDCNSAALRPDARLPFTFQSLQAYFVRMKIKA